MNILEITLSHFYKCCPLLVLKVEAQLLLMACYKVCLHHVHLFIHGFIKPIPIMKNLHVAKRLMSKNRVQNIVLFDFIAQSLHL